MGGAIARDAGLHVADVNAVIDLVGDKLHADAAQTLTAPMLAGQIARDWIAENAHRLSRWALRAPVDRVEYLPQRPVGHDCGPFIAVRGTELLFALQSQGLGAKALHEWLKSAGAHPARRTLTIAPNRGEEWVYCIAKT